MTSSSAPLVSPSGGDDVAARPGGSTLPDDLPDDLAGTSPDDLPDAASEPDDAAATSAEHGGHGWRGTALRVVAGVVIAGVVFAVLRSRFPDPAQFVDALRRALWWWVAAALLFEVASIGMMVRQQRRLMRAFGVPVSYGRMGAITYSSTAIAMSVPAGGAVSAGYSYRKFRTAGASASTATTVLLLSGVFSVLALVLLYVIGAGVASATRFTAVGSGHPVLTLVVGVAVVVLVWLGFQWLAHRHTPRPSAPTPRLDRFETRHRWTGAAARHAVEAFRKAGRVPPRVWNVALTQSAANWLLDALSLYAATRAFDLHIDLWQLALLYLGIQLVRQIPLTPGGIGVVEASLLAGLVSAGAEQGAAAAAVVVYRLFSCWLLIPTGFAIMAGLSVTDARRARRAGASDPDTPATAPTATRG